MAYGKTEEILLDFSSGGTTLPAGNAVVTQPVQVSANPGGTNGTLNTNELAELLSEELNPPFDPNWNEQLLDDIQLILDSADPSAAWWKTSGRASLMVSPPGPYTLDGVPGQRGPGSRVYFSPSGYGGILEAIRILQNPLPGEEPPDTMGRALLAAAVPRYAKRAVVQYRAGSAPVTALWTDRWWGHRFLADEVDDLYSGFTLGGHVRFTDPFGPKGHRVFEFELPQIRITADNWSKLPGAPTSVVRPFRRWAIASQPSPGGQQEYDFTYTGASTTQVGDQYQSLDFDLSRVTDQLFVITQFGVRTLQMSESATPSDQSVTPSNLAVQFLRQQGYVPSSVVPKNTLPASDIDNPQLWGWVYPTYGPRTPVRYRVPRPLAEVPRILAGTRFTVAFADNGQVQPAGTVGAILGGVWFNGIQNLRIS
jgi:hypothetical protein